MDTFLGLTGFHWALVGMASAAVLGGTGSAFGIMYAANAASGVLSEDESKFGQLLPLTAMPGTQGIYGFITAVLIAVFFGVFDGAEVPAAIGFGAFVAAQPAGWVCLYSGIAQGRTAAGAVGVVGAGKKVPSLVFPALVETYAVLALIVTILLLLSVQAAMG